MLGAIFRTLKERNQWEKPDHEAEVIGANGKKSLHTAYPPYSSSEIARLQADFKWGGFGKQPCLGELVLREDMIHFACYDNEMSMCVFSGESDSVVRKAIRTMMFWKIDLRDLADIEIKSGWLLANMTIRSVFGDSEPGEETRVFSGIKEAHAREFRRLALQAKAALPPASETPIPPVETVTEKLIPSLLVFKATEVEDAVDVVVTKDSGGCWTARTFTMMSGDERHVIRFTYYLIPAEPTKAVLFLYLGEGMGMALSRFHASVNDSNSRAVGQTWPKLALAWVRGQQEKIDDPEGPALIVLNNVDTGQGNVWGLATLVDHVSAEKLQIIDPNGSDRPEVIEKAHELQRYALDMQIELEENDLPKKWRESFAEAMDMLRRRNQTEHLAAIVGGMLGLGG